MSESISLPLVHETLGGSLIHVECKGNFVQALKELEHHGVQAKTQEEKAWVLLAQGLVRLLQGNAQQALALLYKVCTLEDLPQIVLSRAITYRDLAIFLNYNTFPGNTGANGQEILARFNLPSHFDQQNALRARITDCILDRSVSLEKDVVRDLMVPWLSASSYVSDSQGGFSANMARMALETGAGPIRNFIRLGPKIKAGPNLTAYASLLLAMLLHRGGEDDAATQALDQALNLYTEADDHAGLAFCHMTRGDWLVASPNSSSILLNHRLMEGSDNNELAWSVEETEFDYSFADPQGARTAYHEAKNLYEKGGAPRGLAMLSLREGYLAYLNHEYTEASRHVEAANQGIKAAGDELGSRLSACHAALYRLAINPLDIDEATGRDIGVWGATIGSFSYALGLGLLCVRAGRRWFVAEGNYERALGCHRLARSIFEKLGAQSNLAATLGDSARTYQAIGETAAGLNFFNQERTLLQSILEDGMVNQASVKTALNMLEQKVYLIHQATRDANGLEATIARLEQYSGVQAQGLSGVAASLFVGAAANVMVQQGRVEACWYRAQQERTSGNVELTRQYFEEAMTLAGQLEEPDCFFMQAVLLADQDQNVEAADVYQHYVDKVIAGQGLDVTMAGIMRAGFGTAGEAEAEKQLERLHERAAQFFSKVYAFDRARCHLDILEKLGGPSWWERNEKSWESLQIYAETYTGCGALLEALSYYDLAIKKLEKTRSGLNRDQHRASFLGGTVAQQIYFGAAKTALALYTQAKGDIEAKRHYATLLHQYAEWGRARALLDLMAGTALTTADEPTPNGRLLRWRGLNAQLVVWRGLLARADDEGQKGFFQKRLARVEKSIQHLEMELAESAPEILKVISPQHTFINLETVSGLLNPGTVILQYYYIKSGVLGWVTNCEGVLAAKWLTDDGVAVGHKANEFQRACMSRIGDSDSASVLGEILLAPFADNLAKCQELVIVPSGPLYLIPFHALPRKEGGLLSETHKVSYLPSASVLSFVKGESSVALPQRILSIGNPSKMGRNGLPGEPKHEYKPLPAAEIEAGYVATFFKQKEILVHKQATKAEVIRRIPGSQILHFATHAYLAPDAPLTSSLLFANLEELTLHELMGMRIEASLVVFSACNTGRGLADGGDEVFSLSRGVLASGTKGAVVSLWPVDDVSTCLFMGEFYRQFTDGKSGPAALRGAQRYLRRLTPEDIELEKGRINDALSKAGETPRGSRDLLITGDYQLRDHGYSLPYYWAPFIFIGIESTPA